MANKLADARRSLIRAQESAKKRLEELENERRQIKASLKSLGAALKALSRSDGKEVTSQRSEPSNHVSREATDKASSTLPRNAAHSGDTTDSASGR